MKTIDTSRLAALADLVPEPLAQPLPADDQPEIPNFDHWQLVVDQDRTAWALLNKKDTSTNTLSEDVLLELSQLLDAAKELKPKGLAIRSLKNNGFVAGAEISEFIEMSDEEIIKTKITSGLKILDKLESFPAPTIAILHGFCLGGGLELALACKYRIARADTKLGFPEVMLGLHPGLAGTWRSLRVMAPVNAMTAMLTGKTLIAKKAKAQGLIDSLAEERHVNEAVRWAVAGKLKKADAKGQAAKLMNFPLARQFIAKKMTAETAKKARPEHYPAPYAMIDLWREHGDNAAALRKAETPSFTKLMLTDTSRNLVRAFFLREKLKSAAKGIAHNIKHVHVIGAGIMGGDIAAWCALRGFSVTLQDREIKYIAPAIARAGKLYAKRLYTEGDRRAAFDRLMPDPQGLGISRADLIIEAVPEDPDIKHTVYADCEKRMKKTAILATNTSSILLENLTNGLKNPAHFCGIHFFNPVAMMPLVEMVSHEGLDKKAAARVTAFIKSIDKLPLEVKSAPGFLVNRALTPYMTEAFIAYDEGIKPELIDQVAEEFGMPMGPIELADQVGLDVGLHVAKVLKRDLQTRIQPDIPTWLERLVNDGKLGKKTGHGIYKWIDGKPKKAEITTTAPQDLQDRLILPLVNAIADCLDEGIVADIDSADAGIIFGTGFAPFRGGAMKYARSRGIADIVERLKALETSHGPRFSPSAGWDKLLKQQ